MYDIIFHLSGRPAEKLDHPRLPSHLTDVEVYLTVLPLQKKINLWIGHHRNPVYTKRASCIITVCLYRRIRQKRCRDYLENIFHGYSNRNQDKLRMRFWYRNPLVNRLNLKSRIFTLKAINFVLSRIFWVGQIARPCLEFYGFMWQVN